MTTLMRIGRDRRSGKPVMCHARKERVLLFGTRSADYIRASGQSGRIQRPNTWLHPNASLRCPIFPLHRGRRPYMALSVISLRRKICPLLEVVSTDRRNTLSLREKMECDDGSEILSWFHCGRENGVVGSLAAGGIAESDWANVWQAVIFHLLPSRTARGDSSGTTASLAVGIDARGA